MIEQEQHSSLSLTENGKVLQVQGAINFKNVVSLREEGQRWLAEQETQGLSVDLALVTRSDNSGLVLLVSWVQDAKKYGKKLQFRHVPHFLERMAQVFGLNTILFNKEI